MHVCEIKLDGFEFPGELDNDQANFRFLVGLRYIDTDDKLATVHAVLPSLGTYWECDSDKVNDPRYVRDRNRSKLDMSKVGPWGSFIFRVKVKDLRQINFEVFDVNRQGAWETFKSVVEKIPHAFSGMVGPALPIFNEVVSAAVTATAGSEKLLFRGSCDFSSQDTTRLRGPTQFYGQGKNGKYTIDFSITIETRE